MPRLFCLFLAGSSFALAESKTLTLAAVDQRTVTVDAVAIAKAMPDRLEWHLQIKSVKSTVKESRADVDASIQRLVMALKSAGIPEKALVVSDVEQGREREWSGRKWVFKGYSSVSEIRLTLTDFKLAHRIQSEVLADDLITVRSMDQISDREGELRQKALAQAAQVAQKKAEILATTLGAKVGDVVQIYETSFEQSYGGRGNSANTSNAIAYQAQAMTDETVERFEAQVLEITVRAAIKVSFELVK